MQTLQGKSVFKGVAIGKIAVFEADNETVVRTKIEDSAAEMKRFEAAKDKAVEELKELLGD